jgi:hypothetical protein
VLVMGRIPFGLFFSTLYLATRPAFVNEQFVFRSLFIRAMQKCKACAVLAALLEVEESLLSHFQTNGCCFAPADAQAGEATLETACF